MRDRRPRTIVPTPVRKAAVGLAALAVVLSGAVTAPGATAETAADPQATGSLTWFSTDDAGRAVAETTYELAGPDGMERPVVDNDAQDSNTTAGTITIEEVPVGEYTITQVAAPEGYEVGDESQRIIVTEQGQEPGLPITFVNPAIVAEDEAEEPVDEGTEPGEEPAEDAADEATEPVVEDEATEEAEQPAPEEESVMDHGAPSDDGTESTPATTEVRPFDEAEVDVSVAPAAIPPGTPGTNRAHILVKKGGDRVGTSITVTPLTGATFGFYRVGDSNTLTGGTYVGTCTTEAGDNGICGVDVELPNNSNYFYVVETGAPSGWTAPLTWGNGSQYVRYNTGNVRRSDSAAGRIVTLPGTNRTFPDVRDNPDVPAQCGLNIAVVFDLSGSVRPYLNDYKAAGKGFVDALAGTPSSIALYTFGSSAPRSGAGNQNEPLTSVATPAGANALKARINGFSSPTSGQYTNWDLGLAQVAQGNYDAVLFLTDGDPTVYRNGTSGGTGLREVEEGIHSANKVKAETSLIVVGIGDGVSGTASQKRLSLLSSDFHTSGFDEVGELLRELALENCLGTLTVVKQERGLDGTLSPGEDWTFTTSDEEVTPPSDQTDANGAINFEVGGYSDVITTRDITVAETQQPGFQLEQQGGFNAVCTNTATGLPVASANSGGLGFTVPVPNDGAISCQVINKVHPTITLQKSWVDGLTGDTATLTINGQPTDPAVVSAVGDTPTFTDTTNVVTVGAVPGTTVTLAEALDGAGSYATDLSCVEGSDPIDITYTDGALTGSLTMPDDNVLCTFTNTSALDDLTVSKTVNTSYDRAYTWSIDKVAGSDRFEIPEGGTATAEYDVTVTAEDRVDSDITISGQITVTNDNPVAFTGVDVHDNLPGATCTVTGGVDVIVPANSSATVNYECTAGSIEAVDDINTATALWDAVDYPGTGGSATGTADVVFGDPVTETDRYVTVTDAFDGGDPVLLPLPGGVDSLDWEEVTAGTGSVTLSYDREIAGVAGECTTYSNVATIVETEQEAAESVTVCVGVDLEVSKNVVHSYDRTYTYDLSKSVDETLLNVDPETGEATFTYTVTVTDGPSADSNWAMSGTITVDNPNDWLAITADVTDHVDIGGGAVCTVTGGVNAVIPAGGSAEFDYVCNFASQPAYDGTNTATATWSEELPTPSSSATGTAPVEAGEWDVAPINDTVTVIDDQTDPANAVELSEHTWTAEGTETDYTYGLTHEGVPGQCVDFTNTAWLAELPDVEDEQTVTVCWPLDLTVDKTVNAEFDREYLWDIQKVADQTSITIGAGEEAVFNYVVSAIPGGFVDSNWAMSGEITVTNPNSEDVITTVTDVPDVGGGAACTVDDTTVVVPGGGSASTTYECTFASQPDYTGGTNTATVTWTDIDDVEQIASTTEDVVFDLDGETNLTVDVFDDKVTGESPGELLGSATWNAEGTPTDFPYEMSFPGVTGECTDYTNTAVIPATGAEAEETVTVCVAAGPEVAKTAEASFDREYFWDIHKEADETEVTITEGGTAQFDYVVSAVPDGSEDSGWAMSGQITVTNPNSFEEMTVTVTDVTDVGGTCTVVEGEDAVLAAGATRVFDYSCTFTEQPDYEGTNLAHVAWTDASDEEQSTTSLPAVVAFDLDGETNLEVDVFDDKVTGEAPGVLLGTATWNADGTPTDFPYEMSFPGVVGECTDYTNTAVIPVTGDQTEETVTVCVEAGPEVSKTAEADFDREYFWLLEKEADQTSVEITGTEATFTYVVSATADGSEDSGWTMGGQITVTNPNDFAEMPVTVTDVATVGGTCAVVGGEDAVLEPGETRVFDYSCAFDTQPAYEGSNTAYVAWTDVDGVDQSTASDPVDVAFELDEQTNLTVDVYDDKVTLESPGELLGTANWHDGLTEFPYELTLPGVVGECVDQTNTAVIPATGDTADETVTICIEDELVITKTAQADFDRQYFWELQKEADETEVTIGEGGTAEFNYVVSALADGSEDSGWAMSGQITVTNPNEYDEGTVTVEVTDTTDVGGTCEVIDGDGIVLAPGATEVFDYVCSFDEQPAYEGSNVATVTWTGPDGTERTVTTDPVEVLFELDQETDLTVEVYDDKVTGAAPGELLGTANWHDAPVEFPYAMEFPGVAGECTDYTNTAVIPATGDETEETVTVCVELAPEVSKTAEADYDRTYDWELAKSVDRTKVDLGEAGDALFNYVVTATPDGFVDSGWTMSGQVTVTNPNDFQPMAVTVTDVADVGGTCEVVGGEDAVLDAGETRVFDYSCTFAEQPAYEGSNTAYVAWTDVDGIDQSTASDPVDVVFALDEEINVDVEVFDDMVTGEAPGELLGTANWHDGATEFAYGLELPGVVGECVDYTNTAVIPATGDEAQQTVTVCVDEPEPPVPPKPEPPVIPTGDPISGGSQWALVVVGITAMLLALLGAGAMLWRRREQ